MWIVIPVLIFLHILIRGHCHTEVCLKVPSYVDSCYAESTNHPIDPVSAKVNCLHRLLWHYDAPQNLTSRDRMYFTDVSHHSAEPRQRTGHRTRKEYRLLTDGQRKRLHSALNVLYDRGLIKRYAALHAEAVSSIQNSIAFLAWNRIFLAYFEEELRLVDSSVSLSYWDSSLDHDMDNPVNSILWSSDFLGNANGDVVTGPFSGWRTARGSLWRHYGSHGRGILISKDVVDYILSHCHVDDIILNTNAEPNKRNRTIEHHHRGVHNWMGGDMADGRYSAYDPAFYLHHAHLDLIWEQFRRHQRSSCHVDPATDFPHGSDGSENDGLQEKMIGFDGHRYIDGLQNYWTVTWYDYEDPPVCPDCKSKYLHCDQIVKRCVSHSRRTEYNAGKYKASPSSPSNGVYWESFEPEAALIPKRVAHVYAHAPLNDGRTRATAERDAILRGKETEIVIKKKRVTQLSSSPKVLTRDGFGSSWTRNIQFVDTNSGIRRKFLSLF